MKPKRHKYNATKVEIDGIKFHSKKEGNYYLYLKDQKAKGKIHDFKMQVKYELIPSQKGTDGKVIERPVSYNADFVVYNTDPVDCIMPTVIDTKGFRTPDYIIKRKLMLFRHGIKIKEV